MPGFVNVCAGMVKLYMLIHDEIDGPPVGMRVGPVFSRTVPVVQLHRCQTVLMSKHPTAV